GAGIFDFGHPVEVVEGQDKTRLINQHGKSITTALGNASEAEIGLEEFAGASHFRNSQIHVIQSHGILRLRGPVGNRDKTLASSALNLPRRLPLPSGGLAPG